ncbi:homoserine kinase [Rothia amarae]|uniref:homoserine kinase n=1 Tax=Rothia amarae TaxID=169480 RepID=UPI0033F99D39
MTTKDCSLLTADSIPVGTTVRVKVPASSANLGPGYDSMGLSLAFYDEIEVTRIARGLEFELSGQGSEEIARDANHLVIRAMNRCFQYAGLQDFPGIRLKAHNQIPHSRGMGSSASAIVAGVVAANELLPKTARLSFAEILQICSDMEGHPDNVAPSLLGHLTVSWGTTSAWETLPIAVNPRILPVVAIPDYEVPTKQARALLPENVPHADAARNSARSALLTQALSQAPEHLLAATEDYLHQSYRANAMAPSAVLVRTLRERGYPAVISGAGPTVIIFARGEEERTEIISAIDAAQNDPQVGSFAGEKLSWRVLPVNIDTEGVIVLRVDSAN